jgi:hypothetical protein
LPIEKSTKEKMLLAIGVQVAGLVDMTGQANIWGYVIGSLSKSDHSVAHALALLRQLPPPVNPAVRNEAWHHTVGLCIKVKDHAVIRTIRSLLKRCGDLPMDRLNR